MKRKKYNTWSLPSSQVKGMMMMMATTMIMKMMMMTIMMITKVKIYGRY